MTNPSQIPLLNLFKQLQSKLGLTIDQYALLLSALDAGFGWSDWDELRRICRLVWLKTNVETEPEIVATFERIFDRWQAECQKSLQDWFGQVETRVKPEPGPKIGSGILPSIPPRRRATPTPSPPKTPNPIREGEDVPIAVKKDPKTSLVLRQLPISEADSKTIWRSLCRNIPDRSLEELDLEATISKLNRQGYLDDVVMRPANRRRSDLIVLVDRHHTMIPYRPVCEPLLQTVLSRRINPAEIYYFTGFPDEYLEDGRVMHPIPIKTLLSRLHPQRTIVFILSDGGAAAGNYSESRIRGIQKFLQQLLPCVREVFWLNPVPEKYWQHTSASAIAKALAGRMVPFDKIQWKKMGYGQQLMTEVQLWLMKSEY